MALPSTIHRFEIDVSDIDRGVYDQLSLRVARHPSESTYYLLTRVIAAALHLGDAAELTSGLDDGEQPALITTGPTGRLLLWIDIGAPSPDRLHKANKAAEKVVIYTTNRPEALKADILSRGVHQAETIDLIEIPAALLDALEETLDRKNSWSLTRTEDTLYITVGEANITGALVRHALV